jgi:hypothetical protein
VPAGHYWRHTGGQEGVGRPHRRRAREHDLGRSCSSTSTTNVIESSFATVRHRTVRSKGCLSNKTALAMIFKLAEADEKSWRRLDGYDQLPKVILGVKFADGIEVVRSQAQTAAA